MPSFSDLPQELLDHIIDMLAKLLPERTIPLEMRAPCLVCRALLPRAQSKIFNAVTIRRNTHHAARLYRFVTANPQLANYIKRIDLHFDTLTTEEYFIDHEATSLLALLNVLTPKRPIFLVMDRIDDSEEDRTVPQPRQISPDPAIFSRVTHLTLSLIQHIPVQLFGALPTLAYLYLCAVTFYPSFETLSDAEIENLVGTCFSTVTTLVFHDMAFVPGILVSSCPLLEKLRLMHVTNLVGLESITDRTLPAPKSIIMDFAETNNLIVKTLVDSVIDLHRLFYLEDRTKSQFNPNAVDAAQAAMRVKEELSCILSSPTSALETLVVDFIGYAYPSLITEVGVDISTLPTLSSLSMNFYCLEPDVEFKVPLHIRDILRTRQKNSNLQDIRIILTIAFTDLNIMDNDTEENDYRNLPAILRNDTWEDIKEAVKVFALDYCDEDINSRSVQIKIVPVRLDNTSQGYKEINIQHKMIHHLGRWTGQKVFPTIRTKVQFFLEAECEHGLLRCYYEGDHGPLQWMSTSPTCDLLKMLHF